MSVKERKERERAQRERLIVATARELAEEQGWDAVTTRRLAERIEYSQPVLYSHFRGKREIIGAVARQGAAEMAVAVRAATSAVSSRWRSCRAVEMNRSSPSRRLTCTRWNRSMVSATCLECFDRSENGTVGMAIPHHTSEHIPK